MSSPHTSLGAFVASGPVRLFGFVIRRVYTLATTGETELAHITPGIEA